MNSNAYKEYYAIAMGATPLKPKASVRRTRSSSNTSITPLTTAAEEGTGSIPGVPDIPTDESREELSWNSTDDEGDDDRKDGDGDNNDNGDDDEEDDGDDGEERDGDNDNEDDDGKEGNDDDDQEIERDDDKDDKEEGEDDDQEYDEDEYDKETRNEESFDPNPKTPENSNDEGNGDEDLGLNVGGEEGHIEEEEEDKLYRDVNINQGRGIQVTLVVEDSHVTLTLVNPDGQQQSSSVSSQFMTSMLNPTLDVVFAIPGIVQRYMNQRINEAVKVVVQIQFDRLHDEAQRENDEFLKTVDENMQKIIKEQVKEQVKVQVSKILPRIEQTMNEQLEAKVFTRSSHSSKTSYVVAADLSEMELKKILIEKIEGNKSIQRSDEQRNLYKALDEAYESDKIILDTYEEIVTLKRRHDDDADKDEESSDGPDRRSKRRREGKEPESASAPIETATRSDPEWFSQQQKPPTLDRDWNKTVPATHRSIQPWISKLAKRFDSCSSFNELMDTPLDFSNFLINRLKVDTLTPELLVGPIYELMKGSCKSLVELEYHLEEVFEATTDQLDWVNPEGQQYPHNLLKPLPLIPNNRGRRVISFEHFINNDLEYLRGGASSHKYTTFITKTKVVDYRNITWIEDLVPKKMWIEEPIGYDKHALWGLTNLTVEERFAFNVSLRMFTRSIVIQRRVEDLQLGVESYQKKLNLTKPDSYQSDLKCKEAYTAYSNTRGFIYQNKDKKNMLMRIDELYKFSDETLADVRTALDDRLKRIRMQYLPQSIWRKSDKDRAVAMIQAIDKRLKTRRIMRSLERFIGGRLYEGDFRMLQRTI
nr:hypothetical protein [Tanacetum cinerariifolium]